MAWSSFILTDSKFLEQPQRQEQFTGIACEAGYRCNDNPVDLTLFAVLDQSAKFIPFFHSGAGDAFVRIDIDQGVFGMLFLAVLVASDLRSKGVKLVVRIAWPPAICR